MPDRESIEDDILPEISKFSDRLMVILGEAVMEEIEKAESEGGNLTALQFWDLAISEKTTADYTVGWTIGVSEDNDIFILERRRGHFDFNRTLNEIADMGKAWPGVAQIGIEQVAYQAAAVQEALRRSMLPIVPVVPD